MKHNSTDIDSKTIPSQGPLNEISLQKISYGATSKIGPLGAIFCSDSPKLWTFGYIKIHKKIRPFEFEVLEDYF